MNHYRMKIIIWKELKIWACRYEKYRFRFWTGTYQISNLPV